VGVVVEQNLGMKKRKRREIRLPGFPLAPPFSGPKTQKNLPPQARLSFPPVPSGVRGKRTLFGAQKRGGWLEKCGWLSAVDLYCVATEEPRRGWSRAGLRPRTSCPRAFPSRRNFRRNPTTKAVRKRYGLRDDQPVLLVLGGGFGMGPVAEILNELDKVPGQFQTLVRRRPQ